MIERRRLPTLPTTALRTEWQRRMLCGLPPHPQLAQFATPSLESEAARRGVTLQRTGWYAPTDDRQDPLLLREIAAPVREHARRSCYLVGASAIASRSADRVRLHHQNYGSYNSLCPSERFWCQPTVLERRPEGFGSFGYTGYLTGPDTVLTCWHGWEHFAQEPQVAIFGYAATKPCDLPVDLPAAQVIAIAPYPLAQPAHSEADSEGCGDWVVLRLERPFDAALPKARVSTVPLPIGAPVYTLGHPLGLPLKLADQGRVLGWSNAQFRTDLDTFAGNSGSPIFDARSHALVGMVVEGQKDQGDFEPSPTLRCYVTNRIDQHIVGQLAVAATCFAARL